MLLRRASRPQTFFIGIAWTDLLIVLFVALRMIWEGWHEVAVAMGIAALSRCPLSP